MQVTKAMVESFLTWPVPADVHPDGTPGQPGRTGTNLMTYSQAEAMLQHVLGPVGEGTEGIVAPNPERELTFGEKAVGLSFNPSQDPNVYRCKAVFAGAIDNLNNLRESTGDKEVKRMASIAITEAQTAQMWAVKAITWRS